MGIRFHIFVCVLVAGVLSRLPLKAQCANASSTKVCIGEEVFFTNCGSLNPVVYDFGDGRGIIEDANITSVKYLKPGSYAVVQYGNDVNNNGVKGQVQIIEVLPLIKPTFSVESCENNTVWVNITDTNYDEYEVDFENDGVFDQQVLKGAVPVAHTYSSDAIYTLKVRPSKPGGCHQIDSSVSFRTYSALEKPSIVALNALSDTQYQLIFQNLRSYLKYRVEISTEGSPFSPLGEVADVNQPYTVSSLTSNTSYCFRIVAFDYCGQTLPSDQTACNIFLSGEAKNDLNALKWNSSATFNSFSLYRNSVLYEATLNNTAHQDAQVRCNQNYCYKIIGRVGGLTVNSNEFCLKAISDDIPLTVQNLTASVNGAVDLNWDLPDEMSVRQYKLRRNSPESSEIYVGLDSTFSDSKTNPQLSVYCYSISYKDSCGNVSETSRRACTILLRGEMVAKYNNKLEWSPYEGWQDGVGGYRVQKLDENGQVYAETDVGLVNNYVDSDQDIDHQVLRYRIVAYSNGPEVLRSFSNIIEIKQNFVIVLPNAFSPNGDGNNDDFEPKGSFVKNVRMLVYNKWGEQIFEGQKWDGRVKNGMAPVGVYLYYLEAEDETGERVIKKGTVTLIK